MVLDFSKNNILFIKMLYCLSLFSYLLSVLLDKGQEIFMLSGLIFGVTAIKFFSQYAFSKALFRYYIFVVISVIIGIAVVLSAFAMDIVLQSFFKYNLYINLALVVLLFAGFGIVICGVLFYQYKFYCKMSEITRLRLFKFIFLLYLLSYVSLCFDKFGVLSNAFFVAAILVEFFLWIKIGEIANAD